MYQANLMTVTAKSVDSEDIFTGGVCRFVDPKGEEVFMMIHQDSYGKPMVSRVELLTIKPVWSCWEWMDGWLNAYEEQNKEDFSFKKFKNWINNQPMTAG